MPDPNDRVIKPKTRLEHQPHRLVPIREIDGPFIAYTDGIVLDTVTGLMWAARDSNRQIINERLVADFCGQFRAGGFTDWRIPTWEEVANLYERATDEYYPSCGNDYTVKLTRLIALSCTKVWASVCLYVYGPNLMNLIEVPCEHGRDECCRRCDCCPPPYPRG